MTVYLMLPLFRVTMDEKSIAKNCLELDFNKKGTHSELYTSISETQTYLINVRIRIV